ncbi:hypothetical protein ASD66_21920 [Nocardioides sp. Root151]|nr:hypothetical protein ASD66_21920 [Nocardioides sp. Root151]KRF15700.1 hypothetical protein ASH02_03360 [Nocardioides sp. Soil796]
MGPVNVRPEHAAYLPRFLPRWAETTEGLVHREVDASLVMFDISGFTRLTERLSGQGRAGAEELSEVLDTVFSALVVEAEREGADLLKWGGDAVLLMLDGDEHAPRAARATLGMHRVLAKVGHLSTSVGRVVLRASSGIDSGITHLVLAGDPLVHRELIVLGPTASEVCRVDASAEGGQIVVSPATARLLPTASLGAQEPRGRLLNALAGATAAPPHPTAPIPSEVVASLLPPQLRTHLTRTHEPEHRVVTAAFVLFDGTDDLLREQGPEHLARAVDELVRNVQGSVARHGVSFHETDISIGGGKFMLVAGAPLSTGDDTDHLLSTVRLILDRAGEIPIRAGIARGRVFTGDLGPTSRRTYSVKGHAVNLAARLASKAAPGEFLAPSELLHHSHRGFDLTTRAPLALKGIARRVSTVAVGSPRGGEDSRAATVLVGREAELDVLTSTLDRLGGDSAGAGRTGGAVEIVGDPGIGKTRLVSEVLSGADDFATLVGSGDHGGAQAPFGAVRPLLVTALGIGGLRDRVVAATRVRDRVDRAAPELVARLPLLDAILDVGLVDVHDEVAALDEQFRSEALQQLVIDLLGALFHDPLLLVVEDTHLLDAASGEILSRIAAETGRRPWLLVTSCREDSGGWRSPDAERIMLGPLDTSSARTLAEVVTAEAPLPPAAAEALVRRAGGHPLFLRELTLAAVRGDDLGEPPESVEELFAVQLDGLPGVDRALLRRAAVLGDSFPLGLLGRMLEEPGRAPVGLSVLRRALGRLDGFVVSEEGGRMAFRHAIHREVAYAGLPFRTRAALHVRAAEILEEDPGVAATHPELLAHHFFAGGRFEEAWRHARNAGRRANERFAPAAAADAFARAAQAGRRSHQVPPEELASDLEALGDALFLCGRSDAADTAYHQAGWASGHSSSGTALLMLKLAKVAQRQGRHSLALRRLTLGLRSAGASPDPDSAAHRARILARRAVVLISQGRYGAAEVAAREAVAVALLADETDARAQAHLVLHSVHLFTGTPDLDHHGEAALRLFEETGDLGGQAHSLNNLAMRRLLQGDWAQALEMFGRAAAMFAKVGDAANEANASYNRADLLNRQGRYAEVAVQLEGVMRVARAVGDEELVGLVLREQGRALSRDGRPEGQALLLSARALLDGLGEPHEVTDTDIALAEAHLMAGRPRPALDTSAAAIAAARALGAVTLLPSAYRIRAAALMELDDLPGAALALTEGLELSSATELAHERGFLRVVAARHATLTGRGNGWPTPAEAQRTLEELGVVRVPLPWPTGT